MPGVRRLKIPTTNQKRRAKKKEDDEECMLLTSQDQHWQPTKTAMDVATCKARTKVLLSFVQKAQAREPLAAVGSDKQ